MMKRYALVVLMVLLMPLQALAASCDAFSLDGLLSDVVYFSNRMTPAAGSAAGVVSLRHRDDPNIAVAFALEPTSPPPPQTRSDYLSSLDALLASSVAAMNSSGGETTAAVFPYDPIAWVVVRRTDDLVAQGRNTIRLSSTCNLIADWRVLETTSLASRVSEFMASLDVLRTFAERYAEKPVFLTERTAPTGLAALLTGVVAPLLASLALMYVLKHMVFLDRPGMAVRGSAGAIVATAVVGLGLQLPNYQQGFAQLLFVDNASLLIIMGAIGLLATLSGKQKPLLVALTFAVTSGMSVGVATILNWVPNPAVSGIAGAALSLLGVGGLVIWQAEATSAIRRRSVRSI